MFLWKEKELNYEDRPAGVRPSILIMHYTGMQSMEEARERLSDIESKVSAHYLIDEDGTVFDLVDENKRAWHAGVSFWRGEADMNSHSIGIEIVNPGHEWGYRSFPDVQMNAVRLLSAEIFARHDIRYVLGHSDIAPERKIDPGELFDWRGLAAHGVGIWPSPTQEEYEKAEKLSMSDYDAEKIFYLYGYNPTAAFVDVVSAFHRHYFSEKFEHGQEGVICVETIARLLSLVRLSQL